MEGEGEGYGASSTTFEASFESFHVALAERRSDDMLASVEAMRAMVAAEQPGGADALVYAEMLGACERKGGDASLEDLRRLCQQQQQQQPQQQTSEDVGDDGDAELAEACYIAASLGRGRQAATIYGGFLRTRLRQVTESAIRRLSALRALHRLNVAAGGAGLAQAVAAGRGGGGGGSGGGGGGSSGGNAESDAQPHVTALAAVLGATCKHMARLSRSSGLAPEETRPAAALLHQDCQAQAVKILGWFENDSALPKWREQAAAVTRGGGRSGGGGPAVDVQGMDFIVDELAFLCQLCQRYLDFCSEQMGLETEQGSGGGSGGSGGGGGGGGGNEFLSKSLLLEGEYVRLEDAYLLASVGEAVRIAEPIEVAEGVFVSSMVEDGGFLLQKSLERSVSTCSEQAIMAVCNRITEVVGPEAPAPSFYSGLCARIRGTERKARGAAASSGGGGGGAKGPGSAPTSGNGRGSKGDSASNAVADLSAALARALEEAVEEAERDDGSSSIASGGGGGGGVAGGSAAPLSELNVMANSAHVALVAVRAVEAAMRHHLEGGNPLVQTMLQEMGRLLAAYSELLDAYVAAVLERVYPPVRRGLRRWLTQSPRSLEPAAYEKAGDADAVPVVAAIREGPLATECRHAMSKEVFERALGAVADAVGQELSQAIAAPLAAGGDAGAGGEGGGGSVYNEWGALLLQRGVRAIQRQLSELSDSVALTAPFAKVTQLLLLLNLERPADVAGYRIPPEVLAPEEVRKALAMRVDFSPEVIKALKL